ncbi:MAG: adaptor protein MecA [Butyrivibrio sp.]|nr:adaptor protein MecA [Muribaculum sp.]MCM1552567.1 adaptor protein MecA [Butyrivibrio sp.]
MKIEKVNENQIRCTLTREDLLSRELKISELAYGTEKAKSLFRDMMQQANFEFGFEAEDIPLMIEAIPLNAECIVLIITKVEDPEELDTRFSRFAPSLTDDYDYDDDDDYDDDVDDRQEMLDLFRRLQDAQADIPAATVPTQESEEEKLRTRIFSLDSLQQVMSIAAVTGTRFQGRSALYKDGSNQKYLLVLTQGDSTRDDFDRMSNMISEYGSQQRAMPASRTFLEEHCEALIAENALSALAPKE